MEKKHNVSLNNVVSVGLNTLPDAMLDNFTNNDMNFHLDLVYSKNNEKYRM